MKQALKELLGCFPFGLAWLPQTGSLLARKQISWALLASKLQGEDNTINKTYLLPPFQVLGEEMELEPSRIVECCWIWLATCHTKRIESLQYLVGRTNYKLILKSSWKMFTSVSTVESSEMLLQYTMRWAENPDRIEQMVRKIARIGPDETLLRGNWSCDLYRETIMSSHNNVSKVYLHFQAIMSLLERYGWILCSRNHTWGCEATQ